MLGNLNETEELKALLAKANAAHDNTVAAAALEQKNAAAAAALEQKNAALEQKKAAAAAALSKKKAMTVQLLRGTYQGIHYAEMKKAVEVEINNCKDDACINDIILHNNIKTCQELSWWMYMNTRK